MAPWRSRVLFAAGLVALPLRSIAAQSAGDLSTLTVPAARLPVGCRLEPVTRGTDGKTSFVMFPGVRENPWIGPGSSGVRWVVDGPPRNDDPPPGPARDAARAADMKEAYRARYKGADGSTIDVYAIRFTDPTLTLRAAAARLLEVEKERPRIVRDATAVLVFRTINWKTMTPAGEECLSAVRGYVASMK